MQTNILRKDVVYLANETLDQELTRVVGGHKNALKALFQRLGVTVSDGIKSDDMKNLGGAAGQLPVQFGGTGGKTVKEAQTNLGLNTNESGALLVSNGGTGATTAEAARINIGAAAASHNHDASNINAGTLPVIRGGTGATTAAQARTNLGAAAADHTHTPAQIGSPTKDEFNSLAASVCKAVTLEQTINLNTSSQVTFAVPQMKQITQIALKMTAVTDINITATGGGSSRVLFVVVAPGARIYASGSSQADLSIGDSVQGSANTNVPSGTELFAFVSYRLNKEFGPVGGYQGYGYDKFIKISADNTLTVPVIATDMVNTIQKSGTAKIEVTFIGIA